MSTTEELNQKLKELNKRCEDCGNRHRLLSQEKCKTCNAAKQITEIKKLIEINICESC